MNLRAQPPTFLRKCFAIPKWGHTILRREIQLQI